MGHRCADKVGLEIVDLDIEVHAKFDRRGVSFESEINLPFPEVNVNLNLKTAADDETIEQMKTLLAKHCPVSTMLRQAGTILNENWEIIRPAKEISLVPTLTPATFENAWMTGKKDPLASSGASSTLV